MPFAPPSALAAIALTEEPAFLQIPAFPKEPGVQQAVVGYPYTDHFFDIARKQSSKTRQVITSNTVDFFEDFAKNYRNDLPSESVTYGNEWDLYSATMAETSARVRRSVEKLRPAELMATLVALEKPAFLSGREKARDLAFTDLGLYWEHDWTADGPVSRARRAAWQELLASEIENYVNPLYADSASRLGYLIQKPEKANRFFVCNPLGETRDRFCRLRVFRLRQHSRPRRNGKQNRAAPIRDAKRRALFAYLGERRAVGGLQNL